MLGVVTARSIGAQLRRRGSIGLRLRSRTSPPPTRSRPGLRVRTGLRPRSFRTPRTSNDEVLVEPHSHCQPPAANAVTSTSSPHPLQRTTRTGCTTHGSGGTTLHVHSSSTAGRDLRVVYGGWRAGGSTGPPCSESAGPCACSTAVACALVPATVRTLACSRAGTRPGDGQARPPSGWSCSSAPRSSGPRPPAAAVARAQQLVPTSCRSRRCFGSTAPSLGTGGK